MKKNLFFSILILLVISATAFAGSLDSKNESKNPALINNRENKLSEEELSRITTRAETNNLGKTNLVNNETNNSKNDLKAPQVVVVENTRHHHGYVLYGGGSLLLIVLLIIIIA